MIREEWRKQRRGVLEENIGAEGSEQVKNEAEQSGARRLDMSRAKREVQRYNTRTRRAKINYKSGADLAVHKYQSEEERAYQIREIID